MVRKHISIRLMFQSVRFQCHAEAEENVHYIWLKNGKPFRHIKPKAQSGKPSDVPNDGENAGDLVLNNLKVNDGGKYTCVAFNQYGNVSFTYELRILRKLLNIKLIKFKICLSSNVLLWGLRLLIH